MMLLSGCAPFESRVATLPSDMQCRPSVPAYLLAPVAAPDRSVTSNRDLLSLLADYEAQRRRFNTDRRATASILDRLFDEPESIQESILK